MIEFLALLALACCTAVAIAAIVQALRMPRAAGSLGEAGLRFARWMVAALLAASGIWIVISPRADQPLLDAMERVFPAVRAAYMEGDSREDSRERKRWRIGAVFVTLAASFVVSLPRSRATRSIRTNP